MIQTRTIPKLLETPVTWLPATRVRAGSRGTEEAPVPVLLGAFEGLPGELDALLVTSDLQGHDLTDEPVLLGISVAQRLARERAEWMPDPARTAVILPGDLYARPGLDRRGGLGDVQEVWAAFAEAFHSVTGVAGNHDGFFGRADLSRCPGTVCEAVLDGAVRSIGGLGIGGVSGVIGTSRRPWRRRFEDWRSRAAKALVGADILVLHHGPSIAAERRDGSWELEQHFAGRGANPLIVCGHRHWREPFAETAWGQVLNVDWRVVLLVRPERLAALVSGGHADA